MAFGISVSAVKGLAHVGTWITSLLSIAGGNVFACIVAVVVVVVAIVFVGGGGILASLMIFDIASLSLNGRVS